MNEDYCNWREAGGCFCFVVADGLGGHRGGEFASKVSGEAVIDSFGQKPGVNLGLLENYLENARDNLLAYEKSEKLSNKLKTTLSVLLIGNDQACWAHIGDTRLYIFRHGSIIFQTKDHSVPQKLAESGEINDSDIRFHEDRNRLLAAFSSEGRSPISFSKKPLSIKDGDSFLMCSDGFWEYTLETEMEGSLKSSSNPELWLTSMEELLLKKVKGNHDNYTAVAIMVNDVNKK